MIVDSSFNCLRELNAECISNTLLDTSPVCEHITQYTHDVVSTSIRRLYDVGDIVG